MGTQAVVALATVLVASGRELPEKPTRYLVIWGRGVARFRDTFGWYRLTAVGSPLANVLRKYGVQVEEYKYTTTVKGRRYVRYKLIVRDERLTARLARLRNDEIKLRRLLKRFENIVLDVLFHMGRIRGWRNLLDLIPWRRLMKWFGIKPFNYNTYVKWRDRKIVRFLKPNWRGWLYRKLLAVEKELRRLREDLW